MSSQSYYTATQVNQLIAGVEASDVTQDNALILPTPVNKTLIPLFHWNGTDNPGNNPSSLALATDGTGAVFASGFSSNNLWKIQPGQTNFNLSAGVPIGPYSVTWNVSSATFNASSLVITINVTTTNVGAAPQNGTTVTIAGITGLTGANGTWVITRVNSTSFTLNGSIGGGSYISGGTVVEGLPFACVPSKAGLRGLLTDSAGTNIYSISYTTTGAASVISVTPQNGFSLANGASGFTVTQALSTISAISNTTPIGVTLSTDNAPPTGTVVTIAGATGITTANGTWTVTNTGTHTFTLNGSVGDMYAAGGTTGTSTNVIVLAGAGTPFTTAMVGNTIYIGDVQSTIVSLNGASPSASINISNAQSITSASACNVIGSPATTIALGINNAKDMVMRSDNSVIYVTDNVLGRIYSVASPLSSPVVTLFFDYINANILKGSYVSSVPSTANILTNGIDFTDSTQTALYTSFTTAGIINKLPIVGLSFKVYLELLELHQLYYNQLI